jgi:outer membrane protein OmpA-like peptidoglycan-associated protein
MSRKSTGHWLAALLVACGVSSGFSFTTAGSRVVCAIAAESGDVQTIVGGALKMQIDRRRVDLERHRMEIVLNRPVTNVAIRVLGEDKEVLAEESFKPKEEPGDTIVLRWSQSGKAAIARIEVSAQDADDNKVRALLTPWSLSIPHQEVNFDTDKANISSSEVSKLEDSLKRIQSAVVRYKDLGRIQLFIAGHTDTVGAPTYNMDLSRRRAQAIAAWFLRNGLTIPVAFEGFGETALLVETKDEVAEARNRRVDYILAVEPPSLKKGRNPQWKYLNRAK